MNKKCITNKTKLVQKYKKAKQITAFFHFKLRAIVYEKNCFSSKMHFWKLYINVSLLDKSACNCTREPQLIIIINQFD